MDGGDLAGWTFSVEEVSASVYRVRGTDEAGRSVETSSTDADAALAEAQQAARRISVDA